MNHSTAENRQPNHDTCSFDILSRYVSCNTRGYNRGRDVVRRSLPQWHCVIIYWTVTSSL